MTTTTHPDLTALLAAVCEFPGDDTVRLVCADWLDEHGQHERAEFIRVQCELGRLHDAGHGTQAENGPACPVLSFARKNLRAGGQVMPKCRSCERAFEVEQRERELLTDARRREWGGIKCPVCEGAGVAEHAADGWSSLEQCDHCSGTGAAPVEFARGFVESVSCRMGDVFRALPTLARSDAAPQYALTPWARSVLAAHPVTRWEITDREPLDNAGVGTYFGEEPGPATKWTWVRGNGPVEWEIPALVYQFCADHYDSPELARDALALAVGRVARRLAGLRA